MPAWRRMFLCLLLLTAGCQRSVTPSSLRSAVGSSQSTDILPGPLFQEMTSTSGVDFTYRNGEEAGHYAMLETLGGGVALLDYDGDGLLDVFLTGGGSFDKTDEQYQKDKSKPPQVLGHPCKLYRNLGSWKFEDVTARVGLDKIDFYSHGAAVADYDRDGWPDLLVTGYGRLALLHNEDDGHGGRRFVEVTEQAGLGGDALWCTSAAWGDLDSDGYPDLYVCRYVNWSFANHPRCQGDTTAVPRDVCTPRVFDSLPHLLYLNTGRPGGPRRFREVGREAGLRVPPRSDKDYGKGLGVLLVDVNGDGKPDVYVANDTTDNLLYLNRSKPGKPAFQEVGFALGVARDGGGTPNGSMGVDAADYDGRGLPSLWVTNYEGELHALYRNSMRDGRQFFQFSTQAAGIAAIGQHYVGFGTGFLDLDNDGWEDLVISNGHVLRHPGRTSMRQRPVLLQNRRNGQFRPITDQGGPYFGTEHRGRGVAIGDLDNDGRPDLVISHVNEPVALLRNVAATGQHWLGVELVGRDHRDVVGARVTLEVNGRRLVRFARGGGSFLSSGDRRLLFGLGNTVTPGRLTVVWPDGQTQHWEGLAGDRYCKLPQGDTEAR